MLTGNKRLSTLLSTVAPFEMLPFANYYENHPSIPKKQKNPEKEFFGVTKGPIHRQENRFAAKR